MSKIVLTQPTSGFNLAEINANFALIMAEFQDKVLYRNNPFSEPNQMVNDIDLNGFNLLNVGTINGVSASSLANLDTYVTLALLYKNQAAASAASAATSETNALASANSASTSAATAAVYASLGLGGAAAFDLGSITDLVIIFPTDWGTVV